MQDLNRETAMISGAFRLPWPAAASWMEQRSPGNKPARAAADAGIASSTSRSQAAKGWFSREIQCEVLGPANRGPGMSSGSVHLSPKRAGAVTAS